MSGRVRHCRGCRKRVYPTELFRALDADWHRGCFRCSACACTLSLANHYSVRNSDGDKIPYCRVHRPDASVALTAGGVRRDNQAQKPSRSHAAFAGLAAPKPEQLCPVCNKAVYPVDRIRALRTNFHTGCFRCVSCTTVLNIKNFQSYEGVLYCAAHLPRVRQGLGRASPAASSIGYRGGPPQPTPELAPEPVSEPKPEPRPEPKPESEPKPELEPEPEPEPKPDPESEPETDDDSGLSPLPLALSSASSSPPDSPRPPPSALNHSRVKQAGFIGIATAVEAWTAEDSDELSFKAGDTLLVTFEDGDSWWSGVVSSHDTEADAAALGEALLFPLSHVEIVAMFSDAPDASPGGVDGAIGLCEVLYDYEAAEDGELSLQQGQVIHVVSFDNSEWWTGVEASSGSRGMFPSLHVKLLEATTDERPATAPRRERPPLGDLAHEETVGEGWVVTPWIEEEDSELGLQVGDYVLVVEFDNDEWWTAINVRTMDAGLAPAMCIELVESPASSASFGKQVRVLFDRAAVDDDELSISTGDIIHVLDETSDSWWSGELRGREGLFPLTHVETIDIASLPLSVTS
ncbi:intersectin-1 [Thecamonas trahens ATCC 50062]|uniref:Intersectin-1 n=1 Tax=Thecamonas trahens ATCC 50062 TaxID=461836 RepID=A0A0L0DCA9_THETB|nr:intersectin-1 [Thecamonas trahens ATCC 50062]KNC49721.1 intersectin-1 [Thecamonas trahens ATCC 50062]|eukprot:XP_013757512.1 intersectin-1 [Thecamonas trahens ATCC 50062]